MRIYLVGGAVRDELMGLPVKERDYVVVGATPEALLALGYRPVGKDFPVFLHPETHEEYALARTERKTGRGYQGFHFYTSPEVTLEDDLKRRDLTINAIAKSDTGEIIDPYGGCDDIKRKVLRHVSSAFVEDPVRILRVARFAARFGDFSIDESTKKLMREIVKSGEVDALVPERVWQELERALAEPNPRRFFEVLNDCGALELLFSDLPINMQSFLALDHAVNLTPNTIVRFGVLTYQLNKEVVEKLCQRYRIPRDYKEFAIIACEHHADYQQVKSLNAERLLDLLEAVDAFRRPARFKLFLLACDAIYHEDGIQARDQYLQAVYELEKKVDASVFANRGLRGEEIGQAVRAQRIENIEKWLQEKNKG